MVQTNAVVPDQVINFSTLLFCPKPGQNFEVIPRFVGLQFGRFFLADFFPQNPDGCRDRLLAGWY